MNPDALWREVLYRAEKYGWAKRSNEAENPLFAKQASATDRIERAEAELKSSIVAWAREEKIT